MPRGGAVPRGRGDNVATLQAGGEPLPQASADVISAPRLEGSRFVMLQLYGLAAGGSRERLQMLSPPSVYIVRRWHIRGSFREPPAFTFLGQSRYMRNIAGFLGFGPKRLPTRRWVMLAPAVLLAFFCTSKAALVQTSRRIL